ncbi:MAG: nucleotide-binding protein [Methanocalculus sp. MSAO_Arc2]|uniref:nucleotide-binding protein n=1 Tax=Methanocalculus sp. MSAO_Arc2 TaxID=2293855 RepID=UPI000FF86B7D|nr:MAG: nucleotide-binding protein [Methanocalculus sp. MSAO_Arc2]
MKIRNIPVKLSIVHLGVFLFFTAILFFSVYHTRDWRMLLWGIPTVILIATIPIAMNYMSQSQYRNLQPVYEAEARKVRANEINEKLMGKPVRFEGVVERVYFKFLNRPQYLIGDRTGEVSVKMFTSPQEDVNKDDVVEVLGQIMKRYIITGDPVINCVSIRRKTVQKPVESEKKEKKKK